MKKIISFVLSLCIILSLFAGVGFTASAETEGYYTYSVESGNATITAVDTSISGDIEIPLTLGGYPVTSIEIGAFRYCTGLESVTIPESVTTIGFWAFLECPGLTAINVDESNENYCSVNGVLFNEAITELIQYPEGRTDTNYKIPNSVTSIAEYAFHYCTGLEGVTIPASVTTIGDYPFYRCTGLTAINVDENNQNYCSVNGVLFNKAITELIQYPCGKSDTNYTIPKSVTSIEWHAFEGCAMLAGVTIGDSVTSIGYNAFRDCTSLTSVTIGNSVTSIGYYAFYGCTELTGVTIPDSVMSIGEEAFYACTSLASVTIGNNVTTIGSSAFNGCTSLLSAEIPNSVTSIGYYAFRDCTSLESVNIGNSLANMEHDVFYNCPALTAIKVNSNNENYCSVNGVLFDKTVTELIKYPEGKADADYTIPNGVISIAEYAFNSCAALASVTIPDSVTSIGEGAFEDCAELASVTFGNSVTMIGEDAFRSCKSLTSVTIPNSVTSIGEMAYYSCRGLISVKIPENVTSIGDRVFDRCDNLTIYGFDGSYALTYAEENGILFVVLRKVESNGVLVEMPSSVLDPEAKLSVTSVNPENVQVKLPEGAEVSSALIYDIYFEKDGGKVQPSGDVTVYIPVPEEMNGEQCKVFFINENGDLTDMNAVYENGYMMFSTDHFSYYSVIEFAPKGTIGDANGDGAVNISDAVIIARASAGLSALSETAATLSDVTGDGNVNISDAVLIARYGAGLINTFPAA